MEAYYRSHPLSHRVLGTRETVQALAREQMAEYFQRRYSADNTTVALAGRLDFEGTVDLLGQWCGGWEDTGARRRHPALEPAGDEFTITSENVNRHYAIRVAPAPPIQDERRYASAALTQILGDAEGSRLYWALVETGLAEEARAQYDGHDQVGAFLIYYVCSPDDAAKQEQDRHRRHPPGRAARGAHASPGAAVDLHRRVPVIGAGARADQRGHPG
ncbi:MAG: M16 family metallopeptidase [Planctomycetota bacterium]